MIEQKKILDLLFRFPLFDTVTDWNISGQGEQLWSADKMLYCMDSQLKISHHFLHYQKNLIKRNFNANGFNLVG